MDALQTDSLSPKPDMRPRPIATMRRVVTEPAMAQRERVATSAPRTVVETLYSHSDAKIVSFTASGHYQSNTAGDSAHTPDEDTGKLAWWSPLERTIAVGAFCVYRAPGSVAFLSCGSALQPILPKSQCWRVDQQNSKFVLQIRRPYYWRIELPVSNIEQVNKARQFKDTLEEVLLFEKTICPFRRGFTVDLPQKPDVKLKPWRPERNQKARGLNRGATGLSSILPAVEHPTAPSCELPTTHLSDPLAAVLNEHAESTRTTCFDSCDLLTEARCELATGTLNVVLPRVPETTVPLHKYKPQYNSQQILVDSHLHGYQPQGQGDSNTRHMLQWDITTPAEVEPKDVARSDRCSIFPETHEGFGSQADLQRPRLRYFLGYRGGHPLTSNSVVPHEPLQDNEAAEIFSSEESLEPFYTAPSSLDSDVLLVQTSNFTDEQLPRMLEAQSSTMEVTPNSSDAEHQRDPAIIRDIGDDMGGGIKIELSTSTSMPNMQANEIRRRLPKKKLINSADRSAELQTDGELFRERLGALGKFPRAIVSKTYKLFIGPPSHLVALMLKIAARICAGEWKGEDVGFATNGGHVIPVRWDYSDAELSNAADFLDDASGNI